ncbi:MAG: hypothetical protein V1725_05255 [archaeon]
MHSRHVRNKRLQKRSVGKHNYGQAAMEYLLIMGFAFLLLIPVIIIYLSHTQAINDDVSLSQAAKVLDEMLSTIEGVHYYGAPTTKTIKAYMPQRVIAIAFSNKSMLISVQGERTVYTLSRDAITDIEGSMAIIHGMNTIRIEALPSGNVSITNG